MNNNAMDYAFEINVCRLKRSMPMVAVGQSLNTLISDDILRVDACTEQAASMLSDYCTNIGHTLLQKITNHNAITLYIKKK